MFIHLHTHSHYSLLDGLAKIDALLDEVKKYKMPALALTDHGVMYGAIEFYQKAKEQGIKPIIGTEVYIAPNGMKNKRPKIDENPYHLVLLAKNQEGYRNLIKLTTQAHLEGFYYKPRIDHDLLSQYSQGLIGLSACLKGELPQAIINGNLEKVERLALRYAEIFGRDNFFLELQDHPSRPDQKIANQGLINLAKKLNLELVATNDIHYIKPEDAEAQEILLCLQTKNTLQDKSRKLSMIGEDFSFRPPEQMIQSFKDVPEAIENTEKIAEMCNLELDLGKTILPHFEVPSGKIPFDYLKELSYAGLKQRYGAKPDKKTIDRLEYELSVIKKTGFSTYFLIVQDFVNWAKSHDIVVGPGRGSAAGSIVSYLLNITNIDPLKYGLLFERFLNPERISMPDIDLDFADNRRDEVVHYVKNKYGQDHAAQIITFGTMASRAAIRDTGRVLGYSYSFCDRIAKMIPMSLPLKESLERVSELKEIYNQDPQAKKLIDSAKKLEGVARHASTHACGVVVTPQSMDELVPRQYASRDDQTVVTQYEMHSIEDLGLLKIDLLGLKNLTIIENALKIIEKTRNKEINLQDIPLDDKKTFKLLQKGETTGVFQLESAGMKRYLKELKPTAFEDIIAMVALYRPGPMEWIPKYIQGKHNPKKVQYLHPELKPILESTYGVCVYQEQLLQIARSLAGFTLGEADVLRKAVGKKIRSLLNEQKDKFIKGCKSHDVPEDLAKKIFAFIEPFASYGFNKSHAACYARIGYETAYLKAHFGPEFMASLLTSDQQDIDRVAIEITECENLGIKILSPDINESFANFTVTGSDSIRFGLGAIKNVGSNLIKVIVSEREKGGRFKSVDDFVTRVLSKDLNKKSLESLIKSGALDQLDERNRMLENMDNLLKYARSYYKQKSNGQKDLFGGLGNSILPSLKMKETDEASLKQKLSWEKELLGLYVSEHPVRKYQDFLKKSATPCGELDATFSNSQIKVGGVISKIERILTRRNDPMLFVTIEDTTGSNK